MYSGLPYVKRFVEATGPVAFWVDLDTLEAEIEYRDRDPGPDILPAQTSDLIEGHLDTGECAVVPQAAESESLRNEYLLALLYLLELLEIDGVSVGDP